MTGKLCHAFMADQTRWFATPPVSSLQLEASLEFLRVTHPLNHVAPDKKSRVQQVRNGMNRCATGVSSVALLLLRLQVVKLVGQRCLPLRLPHGTVPPAAGAYSIAPFSCSGMQAICDMLAGVLQPLADRGDPRYEAHAAVLLACWLKPCCRALPACNCRCSLLNHANQTRHEWTPACSEFGADLDPGLRTQFFQQASC